jgi:hypothetical protein
MKRVLVAHPEGARLYELSDEEFARLEHLLALGEPRSRGRWVGRFLGERIPVDVFPPGSLGPPDLRVDRAIGGNYFTPKWGRNPPDDPPAR